MKAPEAKQQILKRQSGEDKTSWLKSEFVQAEAWMCHTVMGNIPESGLSNQIVETDALRLYWELRSGCGLICGDSLGKQSQNLAFYWKLNKASCQ